MLKTMQIFRQVFSCQVIAGAAFACVDSDVIGQSVTFVIAPLLHRIAHGQELALEIGAGLAGKQMQTHSGSVAQTDQAVFVGDEQGSSFLAGWNEQHQREPA